MSTALVFTDYGGPETQELIDRQQPVPGPGEVAIEVKAAGVNPAWAFTRGSPSSQLIVGLFSSHANELRKAHRSLRRAVRHEQTPTANNSRRKAQPRISNDHTHLIAEGYAAGKTVYELAAEFGCHRVTISAILKRRGVSLRRTSPSEEQAIEMVRLYQSGLSLAKVGERFDVHASTVLAQLRRRGVPTRAR